MKLKFSILTSSINRPTLAKACQSVDAQTYPNWTHLVIIDDPKVDIKSLSNSFSHPQRKWFQCPVNHHNFGNTCKNFLFNFIDPDTDYILYLDDDNYFINEALDLLNSSISNESWGIFPAIVNDKISCSLSGLDVMANQMYHRPVISGKEMRYLIYHKRGGDTTFANSIRELANPVILSRLKPLVIVPTMSFGSPITPSPTSKPYEINGDLSRSEKDILIIKEGFKHIISNPLRRIFVEAYQDTSVGILIVHGAIYIKRQFIAQSNLKEITLDNLLKLKIPGWKVVTSSSQYFAHGSGN
jgi:glycosyltransferase involved in cell wall biosynthesis